MLEAPQRTISIAAVRKVRRICLKETARFRGGRLPERRSSKRLNLVALIVNCDLLKSKRGDGFIKGLSISLVHV